MLVNPEEFPLTYPYSGVSLMARWELPSETVSVPLVVPTSATIFSADDDELEFARKVTLTPGCALIAAFVAWRSEVVVTAPLAIPALLRVTRAMGGVPTIA